MHRRDVGRARDALVRHAGVGSLVDLDLRHELRRVLVELHRAVVVGRSLLAAVERRDGEVGSEAADRQRLRATVGALRGDAGEPANGFGDRRIRQLADVFGRYDFDDRDLVLLDADRVLDALADAGDDDFLDLVGFGGPGGLVLRQRGATARGEENGETSRGRDFGMRAALSRLARLLLA